jgi:hypothetical protein
MPLGLIGSAAFYLASSAGMSILNKLAVTALPLPVTLVVIQMAFTTATTLCGWRLIHIGSLRDALRWGCTVPLLFNAMLVSSMFAMRHNTLGTIAVFRNIAPLFTLAIERVFRVPIEVDGPTIASLLTIVLGVGIYHAASIQFSRVGLTAIGVNIVFAVLERILQRYLLAQEPVDLSTPRSERRGARARRTASRPRWAACCGGSRWGSGGWLPPRARTAWRSRTPGCACSSS